MAFERAEKFERKRANEWQILFYHGAPRMQNSIVVGCVRCASRTTSMKLALEPVLPFAPRLRDFVIRKRGKFHEKTRERVANFV